MKRKSAKTIWVVVVILAIIGMVGFYIYDVFWVGTPYNEHLFRTVLTVCILLGTIGKLMGGRRGHLSLYEKSYAEELGNAFADKPLLRKKLLRACRLYNESNYRKALKYLFDLYRQAQSAKDAVPVLLFIGLCYTDVGLHKDGIKAYEELLKIDPYNGQVYSNLGYLFVAEGDFERALANYDKAIDYKPDYYSAYCNRGNCYFRMGEYDKAIEDGLQALKLKNNGVEAAGLLTIIYALQQDEENKKKYYHLAITSGKSPKDLNAAIAYYLNELEEEEEDEEDE